MKENSSRSHAISAFFRKLSLVQKFSASAILLILVLMALVLGLIVTYQRQALRAEMERNHLLLMRSLSKDAVEPLIVMDPLRLDELVRIAAQAPECTYAAVVDRQMRFVGHTDRKLLGQRVPIEMQPAVSGMMQGGSEQSHEDAGRATKEILVPVKVGYETIGVSLAGFSLGEIEATIEQNLAGIKRHILLVSLGVMLLAIAGSYGLARFLATPLKKLKEKMELVQAGDLDVEIPNEHLLTCEDAFGCELRECPAYGQERCWTITGTLCRGREPRDLFEKMTLCRECVVYRYSCGDEIGELVEVFNQMIARLKGSISDLEETSREKARLEKLSALGEMSMTVAHEVKNPLNAIRGAAAYLKDNFRGDMLREFLTIIEDETKRLNDIVTSFLRFSRPTPLTAEISDLNAVVRETVELIRHEAAEHQIEVKVAFDDALAPFSFDPNQIKQALLNILVNALDATETGDTIEVTTSVSDSKAQVAVRDTGMGIGEEIVSEIFKPFFTTKTRGSGLGLACVERIVKDHGGDVAVLSEVSRGTAFLITLPMKR